MHSTWLLNSEGNKFSWTAYKKGNAFCSSESKAYAIITLNFVHAAAIFWLIGRGAFKWAAEL